MGPGLCDCLPSKHPRLSSENALCLGWSCSAGGFFSVYILHPHFRLSLRHALQRQVCYPWLSAFLSGVFLLLVFSVHKANGMRGEGFFFCLI